MLKPRDSCNYYSTKNMMLPIDELSPVIHKIEAFDDETLFSIESCGYRSSDSSYPQRDTKRRA